MPTSFMISFQNEHDIYEQNVKCTVESYEFNSSYNPSLLVSGSNRDLKSFATGSTFTPYVTTIGLYNESSELIAVAKLGQPVPLSQDTQTNFHIRFDR